MEDQSNHCLLLAEETETETALPQGEHFYHHSSEFWPEKMPV